MKSILSIQTFFISVFLLACSNAHKQEEVKPGKSEYHELEKTKIGGGTKAIEKMSSAFEARINSIRTEKNKTDRIYDWTDVVTSNVWGTEGIGMANYYYLGKDLKLIRFYPEEIGTPARHYEFFFDGKQLIFGQLVVELDRSYSKVIHSSNNQTVAVGNRIPDSQLFAEEKPIKLDYTLNCFFEKEEIIHQELINHGIQKHGEKEVEAEKKRMKIEFQAIMNMQEK